MRALTAIALLFLSTFCFTGYAQETYGRTLNLGLGVGGYSGYYGHVGRSFPFQIVITGEITTLLSKTIPTAKRSFR
jgi:hypothetical protein